MTSESPAAEIRAARLKERVYLSFTALSVLLAMRAHEPEPVGALVTLAITVLGTLIAVLLADVVSHMSVHRRLLERHELEHMLYAFFGAVGAVVLPFVFLLLAAGGVLEIGAALKASTIALIAALVVIGYTAVRRTPLPLWQKAIALLAEATLGLIIIGLELAVHG